MTMVWSPDYLGSPGKMVLSNPLTCTNTPKGENKLYSDAKGVVPSLDLRFAEGKNLNDYMTATPLVDHQRSMNGSNLSPGTFVNSNGLIETAKVNLLPYSQDLSGASWQISDVNRSYDTAIAPDNTQTADSATSTTSSSFSRVWIAATPASGTTLTCSCYLRADVPFTGSLRIRKDGSQVALKNINIGTEWQRFDITDSSAFSTVFDFHIFLNPDGILGTSVAGRVLYIWGVQAEINATPTTYIPTTTVPSAAPRFDHDPTTGESLGLLIEESRTNSYNFSNDFTQSNYGNLAGNIPSPAYAGPGGANSATLIIPSGGNSTYTFGRSTVGTGPVIQTASIYAKAAGYTALGFNAITGSYPNDLTVFDLSTGTVFSAQSNSTGAYMEPVGNGWYRCVVPSSVAYSGAAGTQLISWYVVDQPSTGFGSYTPNGTDGIYVYGAQLEEGSFPTSYIPTTGTALTRSADTASITGSNFSSWYNPNQGTIYAKNTYQGIGVQKSFWTLKDSLNNSNDYIGLFVKTSGQLRVSSNKAGALQLFLNGIGAITEGDTVHTAVALQENNCAFCTDGGSVLSDTTVLLNDNLERLLIGYLYDPAVQQLTGHISRLTYFPERLPDSSLQAITAP